jgi:chaperone modulatory protein CbpM
MRLELAEAVWLDERHELSLRELAELSGLAQPEIEALVECGVIAPVDPGASSRAFSAEWLAVARTASRLRSDFELDLQGLAMALTLLDRVHRLEAELREIRAQLPRGIGPGS